MMQAEGGMESLVVVSKVKAHAKRGHDCNTSAAAVEKLTSFVAMIIDEACKMAKEDRRKTMMDRDVVSAIANMQKSFE